MTWAANEKKTFNILLLVKIFPKFGENVNLLIWHLDWIVVLSAADLLTNRKQ